MGADFEPAAVSYGLHAIPLLDRATPAEDALERRAAASPVGFLRAGCRKAIGE